MASNYSCETRKNNRRSSPDNVNYFTSAMNTGKSQKPNQAEMMFADRNVQFNRPLGSLKTMKKSDNCAVECCSKHSKHPDESTKSPEGSPVEKSQKNFVEQLFNKNKECQQKMKYRKSHDKKHEKDDFLLECDSSDNEVNSIYEEPLKYDPEEDSESNSMYCGIEEIRESIENLEKGRDYLFSMMSSTISQLKVHEKEAYLVCKNKTKGSGDNNNVRLLKKDSVIKRIEKVKMDCYKKIEFNLNKLKNIDEITAKLYQNHLEESK